MVGAPDTKDSPEPGPLGRKAFLLRLPADLHEELRCWAAQELRSLNGQIEFLLRRALRESGRLRERGEEKKKADAE